MEYQESQTKQRIRPTIALILAILLLGGLRWIFPERSATYTGPRAILDTLFALGLLGLILLLAGGLGWKALRGLGIQGPTHLELAIFSLPLGLGILAYGILALGLAGMLHRWAIFLLLVAAAAWTWRDWSELVTRIPGELIRQAKKWKGLGGIKKALLLVAGLMLTLTLMQALTPPWSYDALMYHLQGPRLFLQAKRILALPELWQANGPFTAEMLFTVGLAWESDVFARLLHLAYAVILILATFSLGRRYFGHEESWFATALLLGIPVLPVWASAAYSDMAWALYEFLAFYALLIWSQARQHRWLVMAGVMMGLALGSKYLALGGLGTLGLYTLWQNRKAGWKQILASGLIFGGTALLTASPWYLKNWFLTGNPVYPFIFGGIGWDKERGDLLIKYMQSFGTGKRVFDYLLLPWNIHIRNKEFGTLGQGLDFPGIIGPLALLYPLTHPKTRIGGTIAVVAGLRFVIWALGSQQTRFLLPVFPMLALLAASTLTCLIRYLRAKWKKADLLVLGFVGGVTLIPLVVLVLWTQAARPTRLIMGKESKDSYLRRRLLQYPILQFAQENLPEEARIFMLWDGRGYYCDNRCLPDADHLAWTRLIGPEPDPVAVTARLREKGVTHLYFPYTTEALWFLEHDPTGKQRKAFEFFLQTFQPACTQEILNKDAVFLFELTCQ